jgi:hypothetical protein
MHEILARLKEMNSSLAKIASCCGRVLAIHLGFHTAWVVVYVVSLLGVFVPLIGLYIAFVLGFLGTDALDAPTRGPLLGYLVFMATGLTSGLLLSLVRPSAGGIWRSGLYSLILSLLILIGASFARMVHVGVTGYRRVPPLPASTGMIDQDRLALAPSLKRHTIGPLELEATSAYLKGVTSSVTLSVSFAP